MKTFFVSSTFRDMHFERDAIHKQVSPMVNDLSRQYGDTVEFCDLRWGVNTGDLDSDAGAKKVLSVCLNEIDRCSPYMIVIVGERYGWIPGKELMHETIVERQMSEIDYLNTSVTALEIEYGALSSKEKLENTLFYFREMSGDAPEDYLSENEWYFEQLEKLKKRIMQLSNGKVKFYKTTWDEEKQSLFGIDDFSQMLFNDIKQLLCEEWHKFAQLSEYERDAKTHWEHAKQKSQFFSAREYMVDGLKEKLRSGTPLISLKGKSGSGKSTLVSHLAFELTKENYHVFPFFCGLTSLSNDSDDVLRYMISSLESLTDISTDIKNDGTIELTEKLYKLINEYSNSNPKKKVVFLIDALDQLINGNEQSTPFITDNLNNLVQMVVSHLGEYVLSKDCYTQGTLELKQEEIPLVIKGILKTKGVDDDVLRAILNKKSSRNPLYLNLLIRRFELMGKDEYDAISQIGGDSAAISKLQVAMIDNAPEKLDELCVDVLRVASKRIGNTLVRRSAEYLAASRRGLRPGDLEKLLINEGIEWNQIEFSMFIQYLQDFFIILDDGRIGFSHKVIKEGIVSQFQDADALYNNLFMYFDSLDVNDPIRMQDILYYAAKIDNKKYIVNYINANFVNKKVISQASKTVAQLMKIDYELWWKALIENADKYGVVENTLVNHNTLADFINIYVSKEFSKGYRVVDIHIRQANYTLAKKLLLEYRSADALFTMFSCAIEYGKLFLGTNNIEDLWRANSLFDEAIEIWEKSLGKLSFGNDVSIFCKIADAYTSIGKCFFQTANQTANAEYLKKTEESYLKGIRLVESAQNYGSEESKFALASMFLLLGQCYKYLYNPTYVENEKLWLKAVELIENLSLDTYEFEKSEVLIAAYGELGMYYWGDGKNGDNAKAEYYFKKMITYYVENEHRFSEEDRYGFQINYSIALCRMAAITFNRGENLMQAQDYANAAIEVSKKIYALNSTSSTLYYLCDAYKVMSAICSKLGGSHLVTARTMRVKTIELLKPLVENSSELRGMQLYADTLINFAFDALSKKEEKIESLQAAEATFKKMFALKKDTTYLLRADQCKMEWNKLQNNQQEKHENELDMALMYYRKADYKNAFELFEQLANRGNAIAQTNIGVMYIQGQYVTQNTEKALYWLEKAAAQGVEMAKAYVLKIRAEESNGEKNLFEEALSLYKEGQLKEALEKFTVLAEQGHVMSQFIVGNMYDFGESVPRDYGRAFLWYKKAAEQGHPDSEYNLGVFYADGKGTERNYEKAIEWFTKAANRGNQKAKQEVISLSHYLAEKYNNEGFDAFDNQRVNDAIELFELSAKYGNTNAYLNLGILFMQGKVVEKDIEKAKHYLSKAIERGNLQAKQIFDMLENQ